MQVISYGRADAVSHHRITCGQLAALCRQRGGSEVVGQDGAARAQGGECDETRREERVDVDVPANLEAWTNETVREVVHGHDYEPARFDFKETLHPGEWSVQAKAEHAASLRRTVCSMANTDGGYVLFGVLDRAKKVATLDERLVGIPLGSDLRKELGDKLTPLQPPVSFDMRAFPLPDDDRRGVMVMHVPLSARRPHQDTSESKFYRRDAGGKAVAMNVYEVRDQMLYSGRRLQQVTLLRLEILSYRRLRRSLKDPNTWFVRFDTGAFKVLLAEVCDMVPEEGQLLFTLHGIATAAVTVNSALAAAYPRWLLSRPIPKQIPRSPKVVLNEGVQRTLEDFDRWCALAEQGLAELFGPLRIATIVDPDEARAPHTGKA